MRLIYVSGPYSGDSIQTVINIQNAEFASIHLLKNGWAVITPHKNFAYYEKYEEFLEFCYDRWIEIDLELLKCCDAIFMLSGYKDSKGAMIELEKAKKIGLEIYYESDGYPCP